MNWSYRERFGEVAVKTLQVWLSKKEGRAGRSRFYGLRRGFQMPIRRRSVKKTSTILCLEMPNCVRLP